MCPIENRSCSDSAGFEKPGKRAEQRGVQIIGSAPGEHLMSIGLVRDVEDELVDRGGEDAMHGHDELDGAEVRTDVPAYGR